MAEMMREADTDKLPDGLLATKLYMPLPRRDVVYRPRLRERISAGLRGPLTLVVAPAGWGKTTLLSACCAERGEVTAWLALDAGDNDLDRFLRYLIVALRTLQPDLGQQVLSSLRSAQSPAPDTVLTTLLNDLATLPEGAVLVLDDYHVIDSAAIHRALTFLLDHQPPQLHLLIATRVDPPLPLARLRARSQLTELRAADLGFTADEATEFLNRAMGLELTAGDIAALEARTEGWIAGLHLAALSLRDRSPEHRHDFITALSGTHRYILDYLAGEVFDRQPPEVQRFLLRTSILDQLSGPLCDAVVAPDASSLDGQTMLERLDEANLFVVALDDDRRWYRYHHLFAGFLRAQLQRHSPDQIPELHARASRWLEQSGMLSQAADHALAAADYEQAVRLIEEAIAPTIWQRGELMTLQRWLERLPRDVTRTRPRLSLDLAWALLWSAQIDAIEPRLEDVEHAIMGLSEAGRTALRGEVGTIRAELARQRGETDAAIALGRQALQDLPQDARLARGATVGLLGQAYLLKGDAIAASQAFSEAVVLGQAPDSITLSLIAGGRLVQAQVLQGQLRQAAATYRQTLDLAEAHGVPQTPAVGVAQVYMGDILREWSDTDAAVDLVRQGIARCTQWAGLAAMAVDGYLTLARLLHGRGDLEDALTCLQQAQVLGRDCHVPLYAERVAIVRARLSLSTGDEAPAMQLIGERETDWRTNGKPGYVGLLEQLLLARLFIAQGRLDDAAALLPRLIEFAESGGLSGCLIEILVLQALCYRRQGQTAQAMLALTRVLRLAEPQGYVRLFVDEGPAMVGLLREARSRGLPDYVDTLLAASDVAGPALAADADLVEPLSARELELLGLLAAGLSTAEIAAQLFITTGTVRNHLKSIYGKLDVHSRLQAVERARTLDLL